MLLLNDLYEMCTCFHARLTLQGTLEVNQMSFKNPNLWRASMLCAYEMNDRQLCWPEQRGIYVSDFILLQPTNTRT